MSVARSQAAAPGPPHGDHCSSAWTKEAAPLRNKSHRFLQLFSHQRRASFSSESPKSGTMRLLAWGWQWPTLQLAGCRDELHTQRSHDGHPNSCSAPCADLTACLSQQLGKQICGLVGVSQALSAEKSPTANPGSGQQATGYCPAHHSSSPSVQKRDLMGTLQPHKYKSHPAPGHHSSTHSETPSSLLPDPS